MTTFLGLCDFCMEVHAFGSQGARDDWENEHHTRHDGVQPEPEDRYTQDRRAAGL